MTDAAQEPAQADPNTVQLAYPITWGSETITALTFRRPKGKDFRSLPAEGILMGHILDLAARLCGKPGAVMDELDGEDLEAVMELVGGFMPGGSVAGKKP